MRERQAKALKPSKNPITQFDLKPGIKLTLLFGFFLPYLARLPGIPRHGSQWFWSYLPSMKAFILIGVFNAILLLVLLVLYFIGKRYQKSTIPFRCAAISAYIFLFFMHANLDLAADAQAGVAVLFIPVLAVPVALAGWGVGITYSFFRTFKE